MALLRICACIGFAILASTAQAETVKTQNGSDTFIAGGTFVETLDAKGDSFIAGQSPVARGQNAGDLHVAGFDVSVSAATGADLYAAGATVTLSGDIAQDAFASGFSVRTEKTSTTKGNARLFGSSVTIEGPVEGALSVAGGDVLLNAPITGDVRITAKSLSFGPDATINGTLTYAMESKQSIPERVLPTERVVYEKLTWSDWSDIEGLEDMPVLPSFISMLSGFLITLLFFIALGALVLGFMPRRLEHLCEVIDHRPAMAFLLGALGLSVLFGSVLVAALTIIGLPFVPFAILLIVAFWTLGYALGVYAVAMRLFNAFAGAMEPSNIQRLLMFAATLTVIALMNFIPFVGWVINYTAVLLGLGAFVHGILQYFSANLLLAKDVDAKPIEQE